jgi:glycosyltransferase involved in cell wall biosynthesis
LFPCQYKAICICTGLKNRSAHYLDYLLGSVTKARNKELITLSVFDCASDDVEHLEQEIRKIWKGKLLFRSEKIDFSRAHSFNRAVKMADEALIFVCDADMSVPQDIVRLCNLYTGRYVAFFPVCFKLNEKNKALMMPEYGEWFPSGKGVFASRKKDFLKIGAYDENYKTWGKEDWDLWYRFYLHAYYPLSFRVSNLYHHWHPSLRPDDFSPYTFPD